MDAAEYTSAFPQNILLTGLSSDKWKLVLGKRYKQNVQMQFSWVRRLLPQAMQTFGYIRAKKSFNIEKNIRFKTENLKIENYFKNTLNLHILTRQADGKKRPIVYTVAIYISCFSHAGTGEDEKSAYRKD